MRETRLLWYFIVLIDALCSLASVAAAILSATHQHIPAFEMAQLLKVKITLLNLCMVTLFAFTWIICCESFGLYRRASSSLPRVLLRILAVTSFMTVLLAIFIRTYDNSYHSIIPIKLVLFRFFLAATTFEVGRIMLLRGASRHRYGEPERVLILGTGRRASRAWRELRMCQHGTKLFLGFIDDRDPSTMAPDIASRYVGNVDQLSEYLLLNLVDELIVATPMRSCYDTAQRAISIAEAAGVSVSLITDIFSRYSGTHIRGSSESFQRFTPKDERRARAELLKRMLDVVVALSGLIVLFPLLLVIGAGVKLTSPGPVLFHQARHGYGRRRFRMYKFRSMINNADRLLTSLEGQNEADGPIFKMKDDPRVTPFGRFIRSTSLDELPQLWNVLIGEMSLVGPRPMSVRDVSLFSEAQLMRRFTVRPGITGSWQVAGRSSLNFKQWIALDFSYIDEWSLGLDLRILARTIPAVLKRHGAV